MVSHVLGDIAQEARSQDGDDSKGNADIVHPLVGFNVGDLAGRDHHCVCGLVTSDAGNQFEFVQQRSTRELDCIGDQRHAGDVELSHHHAADVVLRQRDELGDEDVVVDTVADAAAYNANGQSESGDGGNEILLCISSSLKRWMY